jgi:outer membrane translocation and assembly module TamA
VEAGPLYTMGQLTIAGLDLNGEFEMKRIFAIKEGKPFNPEYPEAFFGSIRQQGLFDNLGDTKAATQVNHQDHTVDVTLTFGGQAPPKRGGSGRGLPGN